MCFGDANAREDMLELPFMEIIILPWMIGYPFWELYVYTTLAKFVLYWEP